MRHILAATAAVAGLMLFTAAGHAQVTQEGDYFVVEDASGNKRVVGAAQGASDGMPVMMHEDGNAPATCANGAYWENSSGDLLACGGAAAFELVEPEAGMMMSDGQPLPAGARMLRQR